MTPPFDRARTTVLNWFPPVLAAARERGLAESATRLAAAAHRLQEGKLTTVVCGEFKRGKSSLLNALLEEGGTPLFPTDTMFATSVVSTVTYGEKERVVAVLETDDGDVEERVIDRAEIAGYVTESANPHNTKKARSIVIATPNPKLSSGLTFVDTPGVGGVYAAHTAATVGFLPSADAIVFVTDATQPLAESELDFLRHAAASAKVTGDQDGLLFVLTKIDMLDYTAILANTRDKLADLMGCPAAEILVTPVSAYAKAEYLKGGDPEDLELSNFPELEKRIWAALSRRRTTLLLGGALTELDASTLALLQPLQAEQKALREETPGRVAEMAAEAGRREAEYARLSTEDAAWRSELTQRLNRCRTGLIRSAETAIDAIWDDVNTRYLYQDRYLERPQTLVDAITERAALVLGEANEMLARQAAGIQQELADASGLAIEHRRFADLPAPPVPDITVTGQLEDTPGGEHMRVIRDTRYAAGMGSAVGLTIGSIIAPGVGSLIGWALGGLVAGAAGYKAAADTVRKQDAKIRRQSIKTELGPLQKAQKQHVRYAIEDVMAEVGMAITAELRSRVAEARQSAKDESARLKNAGRATEKEAATRIAELDREIKPFMTLRAQVTALVTELTDRTDRAASDVPKSVSADDDWADG